MAITKTTIASKLAVGTLALALITAGGAATYSGFTDEATAPITVDSGTIDLLLGSSKTFPIDLGRMKPGDTVTKTIVVNNKGSMPLNYTATTVGQTSGELASALNTTITVGGTTVMPSKKLNAVATPSRPLAATNGTETLTVTVSWANGTPAVDNPMQGKSGNTSLVFTATQ